VLAVASPAQAVVYCQGGATAAGTDCGVLRLGDTFVLDLTAYFDTLNDPTFRDTPLMVGVTTSGGTPLAFTDLQVVVHGDTSGYGAFNGPIAVWGAVPNQPFGSAATALGYQAANPSGSLGRYQSVDVSFDAPGFGGFSSDPGSPNAITLQSVSSVQIRGTLASLSQASSATTIRFAVGPADTLPLQHAGQGSGFGGSFTTQVPGPLPLGAVAAALAWGRRLRQRQRANSSPCQVPPSLCQS
jgi:hypothetical protein